MKKKPITLKALAKSSNLQEKLGIKVVIRHRNFEDMIPLNHTLSDSDLTEENGWVWLPADESAIYADLQKNNDGMSLLHALRDNMMLTFLQEQKSIYLYLQLFIMLGLQGSNLKPFFSGHQMWLIKHVVKGGMSE